MNSVKDTICEMAKDLHAIDEIDKIQTPNEETIAEYIILNLCTMFVYNSA
jgi:hypothetical protein